MFLMNLATPTYGDIEFYGRWLSVGHRTSKKNEADVLIVDFRTKVDDKFLKGFSNLKYVCSATTGHTHLSADFKSRGIKLVTLRNAPILADIRAVSQFVIQRMLEVCDYNKVRRSFSNLTVGIIGHGRIGSHVSQAVSGLGGSWDAYDMDSGQYMLEAVLSSDFITVHLPENKTTRGFLGDSIISKMRRGTWLINTARPSIVDHNSVYEAVSSGHLGGFIHDFEGEVNWPGRRHPNIWEYPHTAGTTLEDRIATDEFLVSKLMQQITEDQTSCHASDLPATQS